MYTAESYELHFNNYPNELYQKISSNCSQFTNSIQRFIWTQVIPKYIIQTHTYTQKS